MIQRHSSGGPWETTYGYSRAVSAGGWVISAGCTSTVDGEVSHVGDAAGQAREAFDIALAGLAQAGASLADVVRTRMYVVRAADVDAVGRVHGRIFADIRPASTLVLVAGLLHADHLVEVEVEAFIG